MAASEITEDGRELVKISVLSKRCGVPSSTIKYYISEGLLPEPARKSRNMALYDTRTIPRIRMIKELQRTRFLPLSRIKEILDENEPIQSEMMAAQAISRVLNKTGPIEVRTRDELLDAGMPEEQLEWMLDSGLINADPVEDGEEQQFSGDNLAVLQTLGAARRAGINPQMLPFTVLATYIEAIRNLVRAELQMFREGVVPKAGDDLPELTEVATQLSERLVLLIRRRMLLPTLSQLVEEETGRPLPSFEDKD